MKSLNENTGRCVVLWPHGVLFRDAEADIRKKMIEKDYVDAVIGLGKNLFIIVAWKVVCWFAE